jgi:hypothetical protein
VSLKGKETNAIIIVVACVPSHFVILNPHRNAGQLLISMKHWLLPAWQTVLKNEWWGRKSLRVSCKFPIMKLRINKDNNTLIEVAW